MHLHENHSMKRAGVAGLRERGMGLNSDFVTSILGGIVFGMVVHMPPPSQISNF